MKKTLEMTFRTSGGKEAILSLPDPVDSLTLASVRGVMQTIIAKNIFATKSGDLVEIVDAKIRVLDVTVLA
ncbi:DUF2922 domain-containing protein [Anaerospora hongkongensis]|uniref:DUF2922 domain-containing protein n=1 Tax=Anaerospora hongkongensis TaxID=244830 RepID=UPI002FD8B2A8